MINKKLLYLIVVPILVVLLICFFYFFNKSFKIEYPQNNYVTINNGDSNELLKLEEYIIGVIACEMPASFEKEALKAQAVASRTYAVYKVENSTKDYDLLTTTDDQCYIDQAAMQEKWGEDFDKYYSIIQDAVKSTQGIIMTKDGKLFKSFYFSTSNGMTENSEYVFNESNLTSVDSSWDKEATNFKVETFFSYDDLEEKLSSFSNIEIVSRNTTNHVDKVKVDDNTYTGIEFRHLLGLRSTDFELEKKDDGYLITTYGYGHGVGMSQYGANFMAQDGKNYEEILNYYYSGVQFVKC